MTASRLRFAFAAGLALLATSAAADTVGEVGVDWMGNDIMVDAVSDPKVTGVTCHITYFDRGVLDRLKNGNWFEDPSNNAIACRQTGPVTIGDIDLSKGGEEVFKSSLSLVWKKLVVTRIYDRKNDTLIYLAHSRELTEGSAKMSISTVPLFESNATWTSGKPQ
ncbi:CreA family protein [Mycoplana rhizolycopersici]|uniref:CreA family protein n=1 Tax=Mycoplana rhizolycopersici TaxID=2746702 RepID=A0ABX2QJC8_9HYPH|nr:CreA family protein [Rhizobium rhizolycopersici]NVP56429.1 CreA family protein [Rhizobium rhizolycopersici]